VAEWDADIELDERQVRALIAGQCFTPRSLRLLGKGWDNEVWLADEHWAFRFPRRATAVEGFELELEALPRLAPQLPLPIPEPVYVGVGADGYPWPFFGAELVPGRELGDLGEDERAALARPLGEFLRALHGATLDVELPEDDMQMSSSVPEARRLLANVAALWTPPPVVADVLDAAADLPLLPATCVAHCDLHFRHLLVEDGRLSGVIDWGDVARADPAIDLMAYWFALPAFAREDFLRAYGRPVREDQLLRARVWAFYVGAVLLAYALDVGDDVLAREALGSLERAAS